MDVGAWLKELGFGEHAEAFTENGVDAALLAELSNEDLKDLGVTRLADRKRLLKAIKDLAQAEKGGTTEPPAPDRLQGERRQVTVLFADLTGFTELSTALGAEATHALLNRYFAVVDGIVERYGGTVDKHIGDNVMGVFGAPVAHGNDPERAVRAAWDMHQEMRLLSEESGRDLTVHIGLASGQVVASGTGSAAHREYTVTGDTVNLASRLQSQAVAGETLMSEQVYRAVHAIADCAAIGEVEVKGFAAPVKVWRLAGPRARVRSEAQTPFVGRRSERRQFSGLLDDCLESGTGHSILVRGEAGIGKSRLLAEFTAMAEARGLACHGGLVLDFGTGQGQDAIRVLVRSLLGVEEGAAQDRRRAIAEAAASDGRVMSDQRVFLNDLLDLPQPMELRSLYDAMDNATRSSGKEALLSRLVETASRMRPTLLTIEDVHWADALTLDYLAALARTVATCPAILVMTSRVEGDPLDRVWRSSLQGSPLMTIDLGPLRDAEVLEIASVFLAPENRFLQACIDRAEGNPLFLEQLMRNVAEGAQEEVPGSIQSLVQARIDRLEPEDRYALQAASVIGQRFTLDVLRFLTERPDYECLKLMEHHLVGQQGKGYLFAHALIRDGTYASLLSARRRALHERAAAWFQDRDPVLFAEHLERAENEAAPHAYLTAAEIEAGNYRYERSMQLAQRGLALASEPADIFALTCLEGRILLALGSVAASIEAYGRALGMARDDVGRCRAWLGLAAGKRISDRYDEALAALDQAQPIAVSHGLRQELAEIHHLRGNLYFAMGRIEDCRQEHESSLSHALTCGSAEAEAEALSGLADAAYAAGRMTTAYGYFGRCLEVARRSGLGRIEVANRSMVGFSRIYLNQLHEALADAAATVDAATKVGDQRAEMLGQILAEFVLFEMADLTRIRQHHDRALALARQLGARRFEAQGLLYEGKLARAAGHRHEALAAQEKALRISAEVGHGFAGPRIAGELARNLEDPQARRDILRQGEGMLQAGSVSHNHFYFYPDAIDVSLEIGDWDEAERYSLALEDFTGPEPLPWSTFFVRRGRALAAWGRGRRGAELVAELGRLRSEAEGNALATALPLLDRAIKAAEDPGSRT